MARIPRRGDRRRHGRHRRQRLHQPARRASLLFCRSGTMTLDGRNAIITGANQGLGLEIARAYVRNGANVVVCARETDRLGDAAAELRAVAPQRTIIAEGCDVSREDDVRRIVARAVDAFGSVEILVNNAGVYGPMGTIDEIDW